MWEYKLLVQSPNTECVECEAALNGLGQDGWELVTFYVNGAGDKRLRFKKTQKTIRASKKQKREIRDGRRSNGWFCS